MKPYTFVFAVLTIALLPAMALSVLWADPKPVVVPALYSAVAILFVLLAWRRLAAAPRIISIITNLGIIVSLLNAFAMVVFLGAFVRMDTSLCLTLPQSVGCHELPGTRDAFVADCTRITLINLLAALALFTYGLLLARRNEQRL